MDFRHRAKIGAPVTSLKNIISRTSDAFIKKSLGDPLPYKELPQYFNDMYDLSIEEIKEIVDRKLHGISDKSDLSLDPPFDILEPAKKELSKRTKGIVLWNYPNKEDKTLENIKYMGFDENSTRNMIKIGLRNSGVDLIGYDLIISPKSSSKILPVFIDEIQTEISRQYEKYGISLKISKVSESSFEKLKWKDVEWDWERIEKINQKAAADLNVRIERIKRINWNEKVKFQDGPLYRDFRYLISRFMKLTPQGISDVNGARKILIVDDFITGGSTKRQMEKLIKEQNPRAEVFSLAIFQIKTSRSENIAQENL